MNERKYTFTGVLISILKAILYVFTWILISSIAVSAVEVLLALKYPGSTYEAISELGNSYGAHKILLADVLTILVFCLFYKIRKTGLSERCQIKSKPLGAYTKAILLGILAQFAIQYVLALVYDFLPSSWIDALVANNDSIITASVTMNFIATIFVAPILEEIMCRGLILGAFKKAMPSALSVFLSALIFGALHTDWSNLGKINFIGLFYAFTFGILLGFLVVKFNSILPAIICHMAFNATSFALDSELSVLGIIILNASIPLLIFMIIRTVRYKEPEFEEYDDEDEE